MLKRAFALCLSISPAFCQAVTAPATVEAECRVFTDPGFAVKGATRKDQRWISNTQETGIKVCNWPRPKPGEPQPAGPIVAPTTS